MLDPKTLGVLAGVLLGWLLKVVTDQLQERRKRRQALGRGIWAALALRQRLAIPADEAIEVMEGKFGFGPLDETAKRQLGQQVREWVSDLPVALKPLEDALAELAGTHPVLAARLQWSLQIPMLEQILEAAARQWEVESDSETWRKGVIILNEFVANMLDQALSKMAREHGLITLFRVRYMIRNWEKVPKGYEPAIDGMIARLKALPEDSED